MRKSATELRAEATLAAAFAKMVALHGTRTAVSLGDRRMSYAELQEAAAGVAQGLLRAGVRPGALVAIKLERSPEMIAAMLGVILVGAAYLPIDPASPAARIAELLGEAKPALVIGEVAFSGDDEATRECTLEDLMTASAQGIAFNLPIARTAESLAYVMYTSGSTGRPKGVMVSDRNVLRLLAQTDRHFGFNEDDVWTMFHSFAFDFSVWEIWGCLLHGGQLVIVPHAISRSPQEFHALLAAKGVTILNQTPTAFALLSQADAVAGQPLDRLRTVIFGGEALALGSLRGWFARHADDAPQLVNMYGITETTVHVTYRRIRASEAAGEHDSLIGEAIDDLQIYLLDEHLRPVADGEPGEICIGGAGVARGYYGQPELTAERFVVNPFGAVDGEGARMYRSGDLARRRADGELVYLGRGDNQVKINGFRIELGDVEAHLARLEGVAQVCCALQPMAGERVLTAYWTGTASAAMLRSFAAEHLPAHMRPVVYVQLPALPMTMNGKIDRSALPAPQPAMPAAGARLRTLLERRIAAAWAGQLGLERAEDVDPAANFFETGGTSLRLIALRTELQTALQVSFPVTWMFEYASPRLLAEQLEGAGSRAAAVPAKARTRFTAMRPAMGRASLENVPLESEVAR